MTPKVCQAMDHEPLGFLPSESATEALTVLLGRRMSGAAVHTRAGRLLGYVACRDLILRREGETVADRMTTPARAIHPNATLWEAAERFAALGVSRLVVADDGFLVGSLSAVEVLRTLPGLSAVLPAPFPHYDAEHQVFWSEAFSLDEACVRRAPASAGVIFLSPGLRIESTGHLRDRLRELLEQGDMTGISVRLAEVPDPRRARRIQESLRPQAAPCQATDPHMGPHCTSNSTGAESAPTPGL